VSYYILRLRLLLPVVAILLACVAPALTAEDGEKKPEPEEVKAIAVINGEKIGRGVLVERLIERYGGPELQQLIIETLIRQKKEQYGVEVTEKEIKDTLERAVDGEMRRQRSQFEQQARGLVKWEDYLRQMKTTEDEIRARIREQMLQRDKKEGIFAKEVLMTKLTWYDVLTRDRVDVEQIQVETEAEAREIIKSLDKGKDFSELAKDKVPNPKRRVMREISPGDYRIRMDIPGPEFEHVAFSLKEGEVSVPVRSDRGWHVVKVLRRSEGKVGKFAELEDEVNKHLGDARTAEFTDLYLWRLLIDSKIENASGLKVPVLEMLDKRKKELSGEKADGPESEEGNGGNSDGRANGENGGNNGTEGNREE